MLKQKKYDWKDTNLALVGSDLDKDARLDSAEHETAWNGCGEGPELKVWRVEKFKIKAWPKSKYGQFHEGDSYIVLHTYKHDTSDKLLFDIFFWIGGTSTQDEYGVAAYKTVELDAKLRDAAVQHREVQHHETKEFKDLFDGDIEYLEGGVESGFRHYEPSTPSPELFRVKGKGTKIQFKKVKSRKDSLNTNDVFILDTWNIVYQWNGAKSNPDEKMKATSYLDSVVLARGKDTKKQVFEEGQEAVEFLEALPAEWKVGCMSLKTYDITLEEKEADEDVKVFRKCLYRLRETSGQLSFKRVTRGELGKGNKISKLYLEDEDVFILDDGFICWVWIGKESSNKEKGNGMGYAMKYLKNNNKPEFMPIRQVRQDKEPLVFLEHFHSLGKPSSCVIA